MAEYLIGTYERPLLLLVRQGTFSRMTAPTPECTPEYVAMVVRDLRLLILKYLLAGFSMLVLDEPAPPAGTPFPGDGRYWWPVREK